MKYIHIPDRLYTSACANTLWIATVENLQELCGLFAENNIPFKMLIDPMSDCKYMLQLLSDDIAFIPMKGLEEAEGNWEWLAIRTN